MNSSGSSQAESHLLPYSHSSRSLQSSQDIPLILQSQPTTTTNNQLDQSPSLPSSSEHQSDRTSEQISKHFDHQQISLLDSSEHVYNDTTFTVTTPPTQRNGSLFGLLRLHQKSQHNMRSKRIKNGHENTKSNSSLYAVTAKNVVFSYGRGPKAPVILNNITIKVPAGSIYGILGPSGCGKSTLVHCLVGSLKPRSGYVKVFGEVPGSPLSLIPGPGVGYMPQEIGLFNEFTINETLTFFGRLFRLPIETIKLRISFLVSFLELPDKHKLVSTLSGGQKRRVSLAVAMVHNSPLLVLDEPTVGIDPVLRQSIWKHLSSLISQGITVIITTHYIDEARYASTVAFMRLGTLLEEGNPQKLIQRFQLNNLEEVFLTLCCTKSDKQTSLTDSFVSPSDKPILPTQKSKPAANPPNANFNMFKQEENKDNNCSDSSKSISPAKSEHSQILDETFLKPPEEGGTASFKFNSHQLTNNLLMKRNCFLDHFARSSALLKKNTIRLRRNLPVLIFTILIPGLQCMLFFLCLGRDPYNIPVSVYNGEVKPELSAEFLKNIDNHTILTTNVQSFEEGYQQVKNGFSKALISIDANFSKALLERSIEHLQASDEVIKMSTVDLFLDMTSQFHAQKIKEIIFLAYANFSRNLLLRHEMNPRLADFPIHIGDPIMGNKNPTVTEFMAPGFIMSLEFFSSIATAALSLVLERKDGLLERTLVSGVYPNEYIISHVITQTVVVIFQTVIVFLVSFFLFEIPNTGPLFWIAMLIVMQGVCGMAYGILVSSVAREENFTLVTCIGSMFPQFLLSGVVWPVETMPKILIYISTFCSQAKSIDAVRYMLYRGWDPLHHWEVTLGFIISSFWIFIFLFFATIIFNINKS